MTQPDPWSAQAQGQPAQPFGYQPTAPLPAAPPGPQQAYGDAYAPYNSFDDYTGQLQPPPGPAGMPPPPPPPKNTGLIIAVTACVVLLVAVVGLGILLLNRGSDSGPEAASGTSSSVRTTALPRFPTLNIPTQVMPRDPQGTQPTLPNLDPNGSLVGTITSIDGSTLQVKSLLESTVTVKTDGKTKVIGLTGSKVSDLKVGAMIMVQGEKESDGSIRAGTIISMSLGDK